MAPASEETKRKNDTLIRLFQKLIGTYTDAEGRNLPENVDSTRRTIVAAANLLIAQLRNLSADFDIRAAEEIANKCMLLENEVNDFEVLIQEYYDRHEMTIPRLYGGRKVEGKVVTIEGPNYRKALLHEEKGHARKVWGDDQYDPSKSRYQSINVHQFECIRCLENGHTKYDCPNYIKCLQCGGTGHSARNCPRQRCPNCRLIGDHPRQACPYPVICSRCWYPGHVWARCERNQRNQPANYKEYLERIRMTHMARQFARER